MNLSPSHLRQLFKAETGTSLISYLRRLRLQRAGELLEATHLRVKEVAAKVDMSSAVQFVRAFKREYGVTPAEYRARHQIASRVQL